MDVVKTTQEKWIPRWKVVKYLRENVKMAIRQVPPPPRSLPDLAAVFWMSPNAPPEEGALQNKKT